MKCSPVIFSFLSVAPRHNSIIIIYKEHDFYIFEQCVYVDILL